MQKHRIQYIILLTVVMLSRQIGLASVDTWQLEQGKDWKRVQAKDEDKYLLTLARTQKLISTGQTEVLRQEWSQLRKLFPEVEDQDLDTFTEAELLFCEGKYAKAAKSYDKFLGEDYRESRLYDVALDRQFHIADAFLAGRKKTVLGIIPMRAYAEGVGIMEKISDDWAPADATIAVDAAVTVAQHYEEREMFNEAYLKWSEISWRWETGEIARQALLSMARNKHAAYQGPKYDASNLKSARSYYEDFKSRYPEDADKIGVDDILQQIDEQLAHKQFSIGQYYERTGKRQPANLYYDMVIRNWPDSKAAELAKEKLARSLGSEENKK